MNDALISGEKAICPFCKTSDKLLFHFNRSKIPVQVGCFNCGARGPTYILPNESKFDYQLAKENVIKLWNQSNS